jgi:hypothetical protein
LSSPFSFFEGGSRWPSPRTQANKKMGLGGGGGGKKKRSWDDDAGILVRMMDKILPDFDEWGIEKKT